MTSTLEAPGPVRRPAAAVSVVGLLDVFAALVGTVSVLAVALTGWEQPAGALVFGAVIVFGEATRLSLPGGRDAAPLAATVELAYVLTVSAGGEPTRYGSLQVIALTTLATVLGAAAQAFAGRLPRPGYLARRVLVAAAGAFVFRDLLLHGSARALADHRDPPVLLATLGAVALGSVLLNQALATVTRVPAPWGAQPIFGGVRGPAARPARHWLLALREECTATSRVWLTKVLFGVAIALAAAPLGWWAVPIAAGPILIMERALRRYASISATYQQTIRALSRITELAGYTEPGHARRVCRLALAVGRDLSLPEAELLDLEYAALLHDIGQLSLTDPIPGGATVLIAPERALKVAELGAAVVRQTGVLDRVADILEHQFQPFRPDLADEPVLLAGAIIRAANAYDDLVGNGPGPGRRMDAVRRIRLGMAVDYDPRVVESLTRIVEAADPYAS